MALAEELDPPDDQEESLRDLQKRTRIRILEAELNKVVVNRQMAENTLDFLITLYKGTDNPKERIHYLKQMDKIFMNGYSLDTYIRKRGIHIPKGVYPHTMSIQPAPDVIIEPYKGQGNSA